MITAGNYEEGVGAAELAKTDHRLYSTIGVHPTRALEVLRTPETVNGTSRSAAEPAAGSDPSVGDAADAYWTRMRTFLIKNAVDRESPASPSGKSVSETERRTVVAVGEAGLDYARLEFSDKNSQLKVFLAQIDIACEAKLPMFLHNRETGGDFLSVMKEHAPRIVKEAGGAVVHSYDGTAEEAAELIELGLYIGINGCSLKTEDNVKVAAGIPLDRLMLETDCPWCGVRRTHAGHKHVKTQFDVVKKPDRLKNGEDKGVKDRCEPAHIVQVAEIVAGARGCPVQEVAEAARQNAIKVFLPWLAYKVPETGAGSITADESRAAGAGPALGSGEAPEEEEKQTRRPAGLAESATSS